MSRNARQGVFWLLTIPVESWSPPEALPEDLKYIAGQEEIGGETGYRHWQVVVQFKRKQSLRACKQRFSAEAHCELTRSSAANAYVFKEETAVAGTRFEFGTLGINRSESRDWELIWEKAVAGSLLEIPADVRIHHYRSLRSITADFAQPTAMERIVSVYWGPTGTGKSRRAWGEAGMDAYCKDPRTKFWCGYRGQEHVVIDEFRGGIDIAHLLRWMDRYPVNVEIKGSSMPLNARKFWITSNLPPPQWYPDLDQATFSALTRRISVLEKLE